MKMYKVIALSVGGRRNKIFNSGDDVSEKDFPEGVAAQLVTKGFLTETKSVEAPEVAAPPADNDQAGPSAPASPVKKTIEEISKNELKEALSAAKVTFNPNAGKKELYELWLML